MLTWLRRIASCFFVTLAILSAALWVRSYYRFDYVVLEGNRNWGFMAYKGICSVQTILDLEFGEHTPATAHFNSRLAPPSALGFPDKLLGFGWTRIDAPPAFILNALYFPLWSSVLVCQFLAIALRPRPRFKFSLRDLFTLITVAALTIGPLAFWLRSIG